MKINSYPGHLLTLAALVATLFTVSVPASAASVTYNFRQAAFSDGSTPGTLTGNFTATPEVNGVVATADLTSFNATFHETKNGIPNSFVFNAVNDFFFDPNTPGSLNFSAGSVASNIIVCVGSGDVNNVCYNFTSPLSPRSAARGFFQDLPNFPTSLSLQNAVVTQAGAASTATPEPATSALLAGAGLLLVGAGRWKRSTNR